MKSNLQTNKDKDNDDQASQEGAGGSSGGFFGGIMDAVEGTQGMAAAANQAAESRQGGVAGAIDDMVKSVTEIAEATKREVQAQDQGPLDSIGGMVRGAEEMARGAESAGGSAGSSTGDAGQPERKWRGQLEPGTTYDSSGRRVDAGGGSIVDSLTEGVSDMAQGVEQAVAASQEEEGEWRSLSGSDEAIGSEAYEERLRKAHEAHGTGFAGTDYRTSDDDTDQKSNA